eukprot:scaffold49188_cov31-Tisochrysis_lutea.AAC.1
MADAGAPDSTSSDWAPPAPQSEIVAQLGVPPSMPQPAIPLLVPQPELPLAPVAQALPFSSPTLVGVPTCSAATLAELGLLSFPSGGGAGAMGSGAARNGAAEAGAAEGGAAESGAAPAAAAASTEADAAGDGAAGPSSSRGISKRGKAPAGRKFQRELRAMMFGFGDDANPLPQTVELMEDLVVDYVQRVLHSATDACEERNRHLRRSTEALRVKERDLLFVLRKDKRRLQRTQELLEVYEEQKEARKDYAKDHEEYAKEEQ